MKEFFFFAISFVATLLFVYHNEHGKPNRSYSTALAFATIMVFESLYFLMNYFT